MIIFMLKITMCFSNLEIRDDLIKMFNEDLTKADFSASTHFQIEHHECNNTSPIMRDVFVITNLTLLRSDSIKEQSTL